MQPISVLHCPACGHDDALAMPTDACLFFHQTDPVPLTARVGRGRA